MLTLEQMKEKNWELNYVLIDDCTSIVGYEITDGEFFRLKIDTETALILHKEKIINLEFELRTPLKLVPDDFIPDFTIKRNFKEPDEQSSIPLKRNFHISYKELKNIIHNELKITREEIHEMIKTLVKNEVYEILDSKRDYIKEIVESYIKEHIRQELYFKSPIDSFEWRVKNALSNEIGKYIAEKLDIEISLK